MIRFSLSGSYLAQVPALIFLPCSFLNIFYLIKNAYLKLLGKNANTELVSDLFPCVCCKFGIVLKWTLFFCPSEMQVKGVSIHK